MSANNLARALNITVYDAADEVEFFTANNFVDCIHASMFIIVLFIFFPSKIARYAESSRGAVISDSCADPIVPCSSQEISSKFRSISGRCNNIQNPLWGTPNIPFRRILGYCGREMFNTRNTLLCLGGQTGSTRGDSLTINFSQQLSQNQNSFLS